jgi:seryl-tRNA synthetase
MPLNRTQRREEKLRLYEIGMLKDPEWYIRDMDEPDVDEIIERESMLGQAQQMLAQAQEEIKKLKGDLQTANRAEVQAEKKVEVIKAQADLKALTSDLKSNVNLSKMRMNDVIKETRASERVKVKEE